MSGDKDFSRVVFKVNACGSWATLLACDSSRYEQVKQACETLLQASSGRVKFKAVDAAGGTLEELGVDRHGYVGWHEPNRVAR